MIVQRLAHFLPAVQPHDQGVFGELGLRLGEGVTVAVVEAPHDLPGQLQMRHLVLANGHCVGLVQDDVRSLQHRIANQAVVDALLGFVHLADLLLEGGHPQ